MESSPPADDSPSPPQRSDGRSDGESMVGKPLKNLYRTAVLQALLRRSDDNYKLDHGAIEDVTSDMFCRMFRMTCLSYRTSDRLSSDIFVRLIRNG